MYVVLVSLISAIALGLGVGFIGGVRMGFSRGVLWEQRSQAMLRSISRCSCPLKGMVTAEDLAK